MRKFSPAAVAAVLAIALYFMVSWGFEGLRMWTSPTYGLDDVWRSQFLFAIGGAARLTPVGLIKLAAFFATLKLAVAVICAVHILDRSRSLFGGRADVEILEAGLILVVAMSIAAVGPAVWSQHSELVREYTLQLVLAAIAVALCTIERGSTRHAEDLDTPAEPLEAATGAGLKA
ncbi:MAG TPA: hypothetical protein VFT69_17505 [Pseudolabrys sp.]|nr:hypothetical protein [Pseudolabrys sp.]